MGDILLALSSSLEKIIMYKKYGVKGVLSVSAALVLASILSVGNALADSSNSLLPTANGNYTQWTPSTGTNHAANVDETPCNGLTDYNSTTVAGNRDSYTVDISSVPNGATITAIAVQPCASRVTSGGAAPTMNIFYRYGGVDSADSGSYSLSGTTPADLATTTYSSLSKIKSATSTLEIGAVLTSGAKGARLSRISTQITYTPLTSPSGLNATASISSSSVALTWTDNSSNETNFEVLRSTNGGVSYSHLATTSANVVSYTDTAVVASTTYFYEVRAYNAGGYSSVSNSASATTSSAPAAPSSLNATASTSTASIALTWTDNSSNETNFEVLRGTDGINYNHLATTSANAISYTDNAVSASTTYYYEVRAYNGFGYSAVSNSASATTAGPPNAPSGLSASASATLKQVALGWTDNSTNETNFEVRRGTDGINYTHLATTSANVVSYTDTSVSSSTTYYYLVRAYGSLGYSAVSNAATTTTGAIPVSPSGLGLVSSTTALEIDLSWADNSDNELAFLVERSTTSPTTGFKSIATPAANSTTYADTNLTAGTLYYYRVSADNGYGTSTPSAVASATAASAPNAPTSLSLNVSTSSDVTLNWTDNATNELGFRIERSTIIGTTTTGFSQYATTTTDVTTYTDSALVSGTYTYRVRAYNDVGNSLYSNSASTTIP